jgi:hypothetical protein
MYLGTRWCFLQYTVYIFFLDSKHLDFVACFAKLVLNDLWAVRAEQSRAEQSRAEQSRAEQSRAEQSRAEQSRAEQSRAEQSRVDIQRVVKSLLS